MAFLTKNTSRGILCLQKFKCTNFEKNKLSFQFAKVSSSAVFNPSLSNNYSTVSRQKKLLFTVNSNNQTYPFSLLNATSLHFMSTNSHAENFKTSSLVSETPLDISSSEKIQPTDQVLFTNSTIPDSSREIFDSAASSLSSELSSVLDIAEPTLSSLGLACWYTPVGLVQNLLEFIHISGNWPWWICIIGATATARLLMFPLFVKTQINTARFANHMPQLQFLQAKFGEARRTGNSFEASKAATEIMSFMKKHQINPLKNALWPLAQAPVFISFFIALRSMAKLPVESMKIGGISWIADLTIPDPYYVMPLVACSTLYVILKVGAESGVRMDNMKLTRYLFSAMPVLMFPFCIHFPSNFKKFQIKLSRIIQFIALQIQCSLDITFDFWLPNHTALPHCSGNVSAISIIRVGCQQAVLFYWCTNNIFTLGLVLMLKIERLRQYFGIPKMQKPDAKFVQQKKGFITSVKDAYQDQKILSAIDERERIDEIRFKKAGTGPIPRTYSYDPTKPRPGIAAAAAKRSGSS